MRKWRLYVKVKPNIQKLTLAALIISACALAALIIVILNPKQFPGFPLIRESASTISTAVMVLATLGLAYATFGIINSDREREKRDRRERLLDEIIEWANNVNTQVNDFALLSERFVDTLSNISRMTHGLNNRGRYVKSIAEKVLDNKALKKSISNTGKAIAVYGASLRYFTDGVEGGEFLVMNMTKKQKANYTEKLDVALALYKKDGNLNEMNILAGKLEESMRDNAIKTLDICVQLKADLLA